MFSGISIWQLLIVLAIIVLIFGTKKLKNMGSDLGGAVKGFKDSMREGEDKQGQKRVNDDSETGEERTVERTSSERQDSTRTNTHTKDKL